MGENEDLLSYSKVVIKGKHFPQDFHKDSVSTTCFTGSKGAQFKQINYFFKKINSYLVKY